MKWLFALTLLIVSTCLATAAFISFGLNNPSASGSQPFTALHTYYMASNGNDSCNGTSPTIGSSGNCAWASFNHAIACGDVVIAASGSYNGHTMGQNTHSSTGCPSTSGGIDGTGGVYFGVWLCGSTLGSCTISDANGDEASVLLGGVNNLAFEGWQVTGAAGTSGFVVKNCSGTFHHFAFINDVVYSASQAYGSDTCSGGGGSDTQGADYVAVVGMIAQNAARYTGCQGAIDAIGSAAYDTTSGTHIYFYTNYAMANLVACSTDGEAFILDTMDGWGLCGTNTSCQVVVANNIGYDSTRYNLQVFDRNFQSNTPTIKIYNNTFFAAGYDGSSGTSGGVVGDINIQNTSGGSANILWPTYVYNNIARESQATNSSGEDIYSLFIECNCSHLTVGNTGSNPANSQNLLYGLLSTCAGSYGQTCDSTHSAAYVGANTLGVNTYMDAAFNDTTDLLANQVGVPNCTGFTNTTACMGWDATTATLTTPTVISDLVATAVGSGPYYSMVAGKGFQLPSTTCAANADYPTWLKGIVYLQWNGTSLTENADLVTKPCGL